jgi:hypothetical protein
MRPGRASKRPRLLLLAVAPALAVAACETVYLGEPPADVNACRPSQQFFVSEIWPNFLDKDYGGVKCGDSTCHGALAPNALDIIPVVYDPNNPPPIPLTGDWASNYMTATEEMNCANVAASKLLEYPAFIRVHGGGKLIEPDGPEATLIKMWISQP